MNIVICIDKIGFEDTLTSGHAYRLKSIKGGSYLIVNDNDDEMWYGRSKFRMSIN